MVTDKSRMRPREVTNSLGQRLLAFNAYRVIVKGEWVASTLDEQDCDAVFRQLEAQGVRSARAFLCGTAINLGA